LLNVPETISTNGYGKRLSRCLQEVSKLAAQVRQLYGSNMKSTSPCNLHLTGLDTSGRVYRECVRQSLDFSKLMVSDSGESHFTH